MRSEVLEAYYSRPIRFLKIRGRSFGNAVKKVEIFSGGGIRQVTRV